MPSDPLHPSIQNIQAVVDLEQQALLHRTPVDRFTDAISGAAASPAFITLHAALVVLWLAGNMRASQPFDPYPYSLLTLVLSIEAIFLTGFVLMSQNRMRRQADKRAHLDLQINLLAEQELTAILAMLQALCEQAAVTVPANAALDQLMKATDIQKIAVRLDRELAEDGEAKAE